MNKVIIFLFLLFSINLIGQTIDEPFSKNEIKKDMEVFKQIRLKANSGLYTYRTKKQIDSVYIWAENEINKSSTYLDFYNIICKLTDFEGSLHNDTEFPTRYWKTLRKESFGYFPYPIKWIEGKIRINFQDGEIPLGSEIISINQKPISDILEKLNKYYTTDGFNITGKRFGIGTHFSRLYRWQYGLTENFNIQYLEPKSTQIKSKVLNSSSYLGYYKKFRTRYSKPYDSIDYERFKGNQKYKYKQINDSTSILTIYSFAMGDENSEEHKSYCSFLDSVFIENKKKNIKNLIVDIRQNGGGDKPNDMVTLSYLTNSPQKEVQSAWVSFTKKLPYWKYFELNIPFYLKPIAKIKLKQRIKNELPIIKDNKSYYRDIVIYEPNVNRFNGQVYLLISPNVASAASLFGAMVASNTDAIVVGEETSGGYYGHNGSYNVEYKLPKSNISTFFSIVNLKQDVIEKDSQPHGRGIIPDYDITQTYMDFLSNTDTQLNYVLKLIESEEK